MNYAVVLSDIFRQGGISCRYIPQMQIVLAVYGHGIGIHLVVGLGDCVAVELPYVAVAKPTVIQSLYWKLAVSLAGSQTDRLVTSVVFLSFRSSGSVHRIIIYSCRRQSLPLMRNIFSTFSRATIVSPLYRGLLARRMKLRRSSDR